MASQLTKDDARAIARVLHAVHQRRAARLAAEKAAAEKAAADLAKDGGPDAD